MTNFLFRIRSYLTYWLEAVDEHSLHSPFYFDLYTRLVKPGHPQIESIEKIRRRLLLDKRVIPVRDLGAGRDRRRMRAVSSLAKSSLTSARFSAMYLALIRHFRAASIVELGTSLGINTLYLSEDPDTVITTFEGAPAVADVASLTFEFGERKNIKLIVGNIDRTLPVFLQRIRRVDFALVDANHRREPTMRYFEWLLKKVHENSVIVVDDIHYSAEMQEAWKEIIRHDLVHGSVDLYRCGILFFDPSLNKQHVILQL